MFLSRSYLAFFGTIYIISFFMAKLCSRGFKSYVNELLYMYMYHACENCCTTHINCLQSSIISCIHYLLFYMPYNVYSLFDLLITEGNKEMISTELNFIDISKIYSCNYEKLPNIVIYACKILQKKMNLLKMCGPQIWLCLFTFQHIASKQLIDYLKKSQHFVAKPLMCLEPELPITKYTFLLNHMPVYNHRAL